MIFLKKEKEKDLNLISFSYISDFKPKQSHNNNECDNTPCIIGLTYCTNLESILLHNLLYDYFKQSDGKKGNSLKKSKALNNKDLLIKQKWNLKISRKR